MRRAAWSLIAGLLTVTAAAGTAKSPEPLVVHEWGTFLVMQGGDGATLDGMYHEEHALPSFVHARSKDQLRIPSALVKGETPVIYFYTQEPQRVEVTVRFPQGIWTQWYPEAGLVGPTLTSMPSPPELKNGRITWWADLIPASTPPPLPAASKDALWNYSRQVDSAYVRTRGPGGHENERFIFYRGLGRAALPVKMTAAAGGTLSTEASAPELRHLFVLRVENGQAAYRYLPRLTPGQSLTEVAPDWKSRRPLAEATRKIADDLAARLEESGLYAQEARAMVNTWKTSYFETEGTRVLFVLPQSWTEGYIPMELSPKPAQLVRVMVGRLELLSPERERRAEAAVRDLASATQTKREAAFDFLRDQGRYVEPIVRRVLRTTADERVRTLCKRLLMTDWVTELRSAIHAPSNGARVGEERVRVRAQLAHLLREIGLHAEAKKEAEAVLAELRRRPEPPMLKSTSRHYYRALARAVEATGDAPETLKAYEKLIRFGAGVKTCGGCHDQEGPRTMAWFRDWWAGRRYAEAVRRTGSPEATIARLEQETGRNNDVAAQMKLAYLLEAAGKKDRADQMWARIGPLRGERQARQ